MHINTYLHFDQQSSADELWRLDRLGIALVAPLPQSAPRSTRHGTAELVYQGYSLLDHRATSSETRSHDHLSLDGVLVGETNVRMLKVRAQCYASGATSAITSRYHLLSTHTAARKSPSYPIVLNISAHSINLPAWAGLKHFVSARPCCIPTLSPFCTSRIFTRKTSWFS